VSETATINVPAFEIADSVVAIKAPEATRITALAEAIMRECRTPGIYQLTIRVPEHRRSPWPVVVERVETLRILELARDSD